jgi:hypothetical protein
MPLISGGGGGGGGGIADVLGPVHLHYNTPNLVNPTTTSPLLFTVPAHTLFVVIPVVVAGDSFNDAGGNLQLQLIYHGGAWIDGITQNGGTPTSDVGYSGVFNAQVFPFINSVFQQYHWNYVIAATDVYIKYLPSADDPTAGSVDVYGLTLAA